MKRILLICIFICLGSLACAQTDSFSKAEEAFKSAYYDTAYDLYKSAKDEALKNGDLEKAEEALIKMYKIIRIMIEYPYTKKQAVKILAKNFRNIPKDDRKKWLEEGKADFILIDGKPYYFADFDKNIKFRNTEIMGKDHEATEKELTFFRKYKGLFFRTKEEECNARSWKPYINPVTFFVNGTISLPRDKLPEKGLLKIWIPLPVLTAAQENIRVLSISPGKYAKIPPRFDEDICTAYMEVPLEGLEEDLSLSVDFIFTHYEQRFIVNPEDIGEYDKNSSVYKEYTRSYKNTTITDAISERARLIVGEEKNPYLAAKKIYDYIVNNIKYSLMPHLTLNILGKSESIFVHEKGYGDCGAQSSYFVALCRAVGIPARTTGGWQLCPGSVSCHFWAEFYLPNYGWIPVDTSIAQTVSYSEKLTEEDKNRFIDYFFGNQDPYRFVIQKDIDVKVEPDPGEFIFLPMAVQFPVAVCTESETDLNIVFVDKWKFKFEQI